MAFRLFCQRPLEASDGIHWRFDHNFEKKILFAYKSFIINIYKNRYFCKCNFHRKKREGFQADGMKLAHLAGRASRRFLDGDVL